jgi:hypothetical protein
MTAVLSAGLSTFCSEESAGAIGRKGVAPRRWSRKGLWKKMFYEVSQTARPHYENNID